MHPSVGAGEEERIFVGIGSNLGDRCRNVLDAVQAMADLPGTRVCRCSTLYENPPMAGLDQPDYVNAVVELRTATGPEQLLEQLLGIELRHGRVRPARRWAPRSLDLDLLIYGDREQVSARLVLPHPGIALRAFVIHPLFEIAPELIVPRSGSVRKLAAAVAATGLQPLAASRPGTVRGSTPASRPGATVSGEAFSGGASGN